HERSMRKRRARKRQRPPRRLVGSLESSGLFSTRKTKKPPDSLTKCKRFPRRPSINVATHLGRLTSHATVTGAPGRIAARPRGRLPFGLALRFSDCALRAQVEPVWSCVAGSNEPQSGG